MSRNCEDIPCIYFDEYSLVYIWATIRCVLNTVQGYIPIACYSSLLISNSQNLIFIVQVRHFQSISDNLRILSQLLPPAYIVRQEVNSFTLLVCPHPGGGVPISHNALQHFPECHGADQGGYPAGGRGVPCRGGTQVGQHREYLLHGGQYASCIHAGLSCDT